MWARRGQGSVDVTSLVLRDRQLVAGEPPHRVLVALERSDRISDRLQHVVLDLDGSAARRAVATILGNHDRQDVAGIRGAAALGDEHRPVLVDQPHLELAGNVGGGEHPHHSRNGAGRRRIDPEDIGPGVVAETKGAVEQAVDSEVVDEPAVPQGQLGASYLTPDLPIPPGSCGSGMGAPEASNSIASMILM